MIVRHRHDIAYSVRSRTVFALGKNVTKSENINREFSQLTVRPTPSTIAVVLHVSYSWRCVTELSRCIFLCSPESNTSRWAKTSRRQPTEGDGSSTCLGGSTDGYLLECFKVDDSRLSRGARCRLRTISVHSLVLHSQAAIDTPQPPPSMP